MYAQVHGNLVCRMWPSVSLTGETIYLGAILITSFQRQKANVECVCDGVME